ncbi:MAG: hypothetical protein ED859_13260 [Desulfuromonadales bacterium]|nr:MAG: hypothetical protein ED859_13260 [Desulfuromonadales bacterium]
MAAPLTCRLFFVLLAFCAGWSYAYGRSTSPAGIEGLYALTADRAATLQVTKAGTRYEVMVSGGTGGATGGGAPADCPVKGMGVLKGNILTAAFAPLETDTFFYSKGQADRERRKLRIVFDRDRRTARITRADVSGYCGLGANLTGRYLRVQSPP